MRFLLYFIAFLLCLPCIHAQDNAKEWAFVNRANGYGRFLKQGQVLTVTWHDKHGPQISKGKLMEITEDSLLLQLKKEKYESIAKKDVDKLKYRKIGSSGTRILGCLLIVVGILLAGIIILFQAVFDSTRIDAQLARGERTIIWPWAFLGCIVLTLGIANLKSSNIKISKPFEKEWMVQELPNIPSNSP